MKGLKLRVYLKKEKKLIYDIKNIDFVNNLVLIGSTSYSFSDMYIDQYIEKKDIKGKEIYEGDIVKFDNPSIIGFVNNIGEIFYDNDNAAYSIRTKNNLSETYKYKINSLYNFEVIGNRYRAK